MICKFHVVAISVFLVSIAVIGLAEEKPPEDTAAKPIDAVSLELYTKYIAPVGKINSSSIEAAIVLVADRSGDVPEFRELLRKDFATSRQEDNQHYDSRKLLALITAVLRRDGSKRWQHEDAKRPGSIPNQRPLPSAKFLYQEAPLLADVITYGQQSGRSDIDAFTFAIRQAHHPQGKQFLLDVLRNRPQTVALMPPPGKQATVKAEGKWTDNVGGSWKEQFHAAVGLAELGIKEGVEWLIERARPNEFGIDGSVDRHPRLGIRTSSLRENCHAALYDLSGLKLQADGSHPAWNEWWQKNAATFTPRRVSLQE